MTTRNVSLTEALDRFVDDQLQTGDYQNASEVVRAGLRLLKQQSDEQTQKLARLRAAVQEGIDDVERGDVIEIEWDRLDAWLDDLSREPPAR
jgi:antitoxin ParD1/3/4